MHTRRKRSAAGIEALVVLLASCAVGPNFARPEAPHPPGYTAEPTPTAMTPAAGEGEQRLELAREISAQWWQAFRSPELDAVIERALRDSPNLVVARATLAEAEQAVAAARGGLFPQLDASGTVSRQRTPQTSLNSSNKTSVKANTSNFYSVGPTISYTLDVFGGIRRGV